MRGQSKISSCCFFGVNQEKGKSEIPFCSPSGGKLLLRRSSSYNNLLGKVVFRILSNIHDGTHPRK